MKANEKGLKRENKKGERRREMRKIAIMFVFLAVLLFYASPLFAECLRNVNVTYVKDGKSVIENVWHDGELTIYRDSGTQVDLLVMRYTSCGDTYEYFYADTINSKSDIVETTKSSYTFYDAVGSEDTKIWIGINDMADHATVYVYNVAVSSEPDLTVSNITVDGYTNPSQIFTVGQTVAVRSIVRCKEADCPFNYLGYYLGNSDDDTDDRWERDSVSALDSGESSVESESYTFNTSDIGDNKYFILVPDYQNVVAEGSESNNMEYWGPFKVVAANNPPAVNPGSNIGVNEWQPFTLSCICTDPDNDITACYWQYDSGSQNVTSPGSSVIVSGLPAGTYYPTCVGKDDDSATTSQSITVTVTKPAPLPTTGMLSGVVKGEKGEIIGSGTVKAGNTTASIGVNGVFTLQNLEQGSYTLEVKSSCYLDGSVKTDVLASTSNEKNITLLRTGLPLANAGQDQTAVAGTPVTVTGTDGSPCGGVAARVWKEGGNVLSNQASAVLTYYAPGTHTLTFTVIDTFGYQSSDTVKVTSTPPPVANMAPTVSVSAAQTVQSGTPVSLACICNDGDGNEVSCAWISGWDVDPKATLVNTGIATSSADRLVTGLPEGEHLFVCRATDQFGAFGSGETVVTVTPKNNGPEITDIEVENSIKVGSPFSVAITTTHHLGQLLKYKWFVNGKAEKETDLSASYADSFAYSPLAVGSYLVEVYVYDEEGLSAYSSRFFAILSAFNSDQMFFDIGQDVMGPFVLYEGFKFRTKEDFEERLDNVFTGKTIVIEEVEDVQRRYSITVSSDEEVAEEFNLGTLFLALVDRCPEGNTKCLGVNVGASTIPLVETGVELSAILVNTAIAAGDFVWFLKTDDEVYYNDFISSMSTAGINTVGAVIPCISLRTGKAFFKIAKSVKAGANIALKSVDEWKLIPEDQVAKDLVKGGFPTEMLDEAVALTKNGYTPKEVEDLLKLSGVYDDAVKKIVVNIPGNKQALLKIAAKLTPAEMRSFTDTFLGGFTSSMHQYHDMDELIGKGIDLARFGDKEIEAVKKLAADQNVIADLAEKLEKFGLSDAEKTILNRAKRDVSEGNVRLLHKAIGISSDLVSTDGIVFLVKIGSNPPQFAKRLADNGNGIKGYRDFTDIDALAIINKSDGMVEVRRVEAKYPDLYTVANKEKETSGKEIIAQLNDVDNPYFVKYLQEQGHIPSGTNVVMTKALVAGNGKEYVYLGSKQGVTYYDLIPTGSWGSFTAGTTTINPPAGQIVKVTLDVKKGVNTFVAPYDLPATPASEVFKNSLKDISSIKVKEGKKWVTWAPSSKKPFLIKGGETYRITMKKKTTLALTVPAS